MNPARFVQKQGSSSHPKTVEPAPNTPDIDNFISGFSHPKFKLLLYHFFERMIFIARRPKSP